MQGYLWLSLCERGANLEFEGAHLLILSAQERYIYLVALLHHEIRFARFVAVGGLVWINRELDCKAALIVFGY